MPRGQFLPVTITAVLIVPLAARAQDPFSVAPVAPVTRAGNQWGLTFRLDESWDSNARFAADAQDSLVHRGTVMMSHQRRVGRGALSLAARGSLSAYSASGLDHSAYGGMLVLNHPLSRRASIGLSGSGDTSYAYEDPALLRSGIVLPATLTHFYSATGRLDLHPSTWLTAGAVAGYERRSFDTDAPTQLVGGSSSTIQGFLSPRLSGRDAIRLSYTLRRNEFDGAGVGTHSAMVGWTRAITNRFTASLTGGGTRFRAVANADAQWTVNGGAALALTRQRSSVNAQYERAVDQAYGLGRNHIADVVRATWSLTPTRDLGLAVSATYAFSGDQVDPSFRRRSAHGTAQITRAMGRRMQIQAGYGFRSFRDGNTANSSAHYVTVSLAYSLAWPQSRAPRPRRGTRT